MTDVFSKEKRSEIMSAIRSKNSSAELIAFSYLRSQHIYFQKHYAKAPGKPDIALPRKKRAVFIDGDFWHGRHFDRVLQSRPAEDYWVKKLEYNISRDKQQLEELTKLGWTVLRVWESDIKRKRTRYDSLDKIAVFMTRPRKY